MRETVQEYYGKVLSNSSDLKTNACTTDSAPDAHVRAALAQVHGEVQARYYGCGFISPPAIEGARVLDLGCGTGRDCYVLSQWVGENGAVVGVDMTKEQLAVAREYEEYHRLRFGHSQSNVQFLEGYIEALPELGLEPNSFDVIVSNCVINLSPDKPAVLAAAYDLLKPGGEIFFADVYANRRLPEELASDPVLYGECLGGAMYWNDFEQLARRVGFEDPRVYSDRPLSIENEDIQRRLEGFEFRSVTYRLFKVPGLEPSCEDYGQAVIYRGDVENHPNRFILDGHHIMETGRVFPVCGNTWNILEHSRFSQHFQFIGSFDRHFGLFDGCGEMNRVSESDEADPVSACC